MPSRNTIKIDVAKQYYHVYARGNNRFEIFLNPDDYAVFLNICKRYVSKQQQTNKLGTPYQHLYGDLELVCFCLMPNHFHLLIYQNTKGSMVRFMRGVMTSYSRYFNTKYDRCGSVWESRYKASLIDNQQYLTHITRYIHLNPSGWASYQYSSLPFYDGRREASWVKPRRILNMFETRSDYLEFLKDYEDHKKMLDSIKYELAHTIN